MFKMHYLRNKFPKIAKCWGRSFRHWWLKVVWLGLIVVLHFSCYDEIELLKHQLWYHFSNIIIVAQLKIFTKLTSQDFTVLIPSPPIEISSYASRQLQWRRILGLVGSASADGGHPVSGGEASSRRSLGV